MSANPQSVSTGSAFQLLIGGRKVPGAAQLDVINPATGKVFASCARASRAQLDAAVAAAKSAFPTWSKLPLAERRALLLKIAAALTARIEEFARLLTQETGKPLAAAQREMKGCIGLTHAYAALDFIEPTIVRDIPDSARPVREEQFGPVLPVLRYSDVNDAIERANSTEYGLGSSVWSADAERAFEVAQQIGSGTVWVNKHLEVAPEGPFGGAKQSGFGVEMGQEGLEEFTQVRIINLNK